MVQMTNEARVAGKASVLTGNRRRPSIVVLVKPMGQPFGHRWKKPGT